MARYELQADFNHKLAQRNSNNSKRKSQSEDPAMKPVIFFAISENRTREIGLAVFSLSSPQLDLYTYDDFGGYAITQTLIQLYQPTEILLPHTAVDGEMHTIMRNYYDCSYVSVARKFFNESKGALTIKNISIDAAADESLLADKYLALSSVAALVKYVEFIQHISLPPQSMKINLKSSQGTMLIDSVTAKCLELVVTSDGSSAKSLLGILDHTKTAAGARFLCSNILQPPSDINAITMRHQCVAEFLSKEKMYFDVVGLLPHFLDLEHLLSILIQIPNDPSKIVSGNKIKAIIALKSNLEILSKLAMALEDAENSLLQSIKLNIDNILIKSFKEKIDALINESTTFSKNTHYMKMHQSFAIKAGISPLLDVARQTYTETVEDIYNLANSYSKQCNLNFKVSYSAKRGYFMSVCAPALPTLFIQCCSQGKKTTCTTHALVSLNRRNQDALEEIFILTDRVLADFILGDLRDNLTALFKIQDSIAFLDMISSFVTYVALTDSCVCPEMSSSVLAVYQARHPILEKISLRPYIPNNIYASQFESFHVITGPNMSGKSTFLSQICLITIMAQIGCYVPATYASIKIFDRIFTRTGTSDSIESNSSSFMQEMREMAHIVKNSTSDSLVIIDELGRSTSNITALPICYSICEYFVGLGGFTWFATHYDELAKDLPEMYLNAKSHRFKVNAQISKEGNKSLVFTYQIEDGAETESDYGLEIATMAGLPSKVVNDARQVKLLLRQYTAQERCSSRAKSSLVTLCQQLQLLRNSSLEESGLRAYLIGLKNKFCPT